MKHPVRPLPAASTLITTCLAALLAARPAACPAQEAAPPSREVGGRAIRAAPVAAAPDDDCACDLEAEYEFAIGAQTFSGNDLDATYGLLPSIGAAMSWRLLGGTRLVIGARYAVSRGDPYYDSPEFRTGESARLRTVPVTMGIRSNLNPGRRLRYHLGCALQLAWMEETVPVAGGAGRFTGFGGGPLVTTGPEWRTRDGRGAVGLELAYGGRGGSVERDGLEHDVNLTGFHARVYYTFRSGAAGPDGEGSP